MSLIPKVKASCALKMDCLTVFTRIDNGMKIQAKYSVGGDDLVYMVRRGESNEIISSQIISVEEFDKRYTYLLPLLYPECENAKESKNTCEKLLTNL